jgi:hypothetical protein
MTEPTTGTDLVGQALRRRNRRLNMAGFARDLGIASDRLEAFADGRIGLASETKQAIVRDIWAGDVEFDAELNLLRSANKEEPRPLGVRPPPIDPATLPTFRGSLPLIGPQLVTPPKPKETKRAGWLGGWL